VLLDGYGRYRMFFKEALDKIGVDINVFRVGSFKSAVEAYTRTDMSPEDKEESLAYLNALWSSYQAAMTGRGSCPTAPSRRTLTPWRRLSRPLVVNAAQVALQAGLVTGVKSRQEVEKRLIDLVGADDSTGSFQSVHEQDYVRIAPCREEGTRWWQEACGSDRGVRGNSGR